MSKVIFTVSLFILFLTGQLFCQNDTIGNNDTVSTDQLNYELLVFAYEGEAENIKLWIEKGADVNAVSENGISALMYAVQQGHLLAVKTLVANGAKIDYQPYGDVSALSTAVINNKIDIVDYLLFKSAKVNIKDDRNITPLMYAAAYGYYNITQLLIKYKADVNLKDQYGNDALMLSLLYNHAEIFDYLIESGANINSKDNRGFSSMHVAAQNGMVYYIKLLNYYGADISLKNNYDCNALDVSIINNQIGAIQTITNIDSLGIFKNARPAKMAYLSGNRGVVKKLWEHGYPPYLFPIFDKLSVGYGTDMNFNDLMFGFTLGIRDSRYNIIWGVSHFSRYWAKRIRMDYGNDIYYQFWERRSMVGFYADKRFKLSGIGSKQNGISIGFQESYTYGKYRGAEIKPSGSWIPIPRLGLYTEGNYGGISFNFEYFNFKTQLESSLRLNINTYIYIGLRKFSSIKKVPEW